jgi:hypothetical protein
MVHRPVSSHLSERSEARELAENGYIQHHVVCWIIKYSKNRLNLQLLV